MQTFKDLLQKAKEKGYQQLLPDFGDEHIRPVPEGSLSQVEELRSIRAWVMIQLKNKKGTDVEEFKDRFYDMHFSKLVEELYNEVDKL